MCQSWHVTNFFFNKKEKEKERKKDKRDKILVSTQMPREGQQKK
jgi:hypothetical protein